MNTIQTIKVSSYSMIYTATHSVPFNCTTRDLVDLYQCFDIFGLHNLYSFNYTMTKGWFGKWYSFHWIYCSSHSLTCKFIFAIISLIEKWNPFHSTLDKMITDVCLVIKYGKFLLLTLLISVSFWLFYPPQFFSLQSISLQLFTYKSLKAVSTKRCCLWRLQLYIWLLGIVGSWSW